MTAVGYTREQLIEICERAVVDVCKWSNRDSPEAQEKVGQAWAALKAGCTYSIHPGRPEGARSGCWTDGRTIWITITRPTFNSFEYGLSEYDRSETHYLPTPQRLDECADHDWY